MKWELPRNPWLRRLCKKAQRNNPCKCIIEFYNKSGQKCSRMRDYNVLICHEGVFLLVDYNYLLDTKIDKAYEEFISLVKEKDLFAKLTERDEEYYRENTE